MLSKAKVRELFFIYVRKLDGDKIADRCLAIAAQNPAWDCPEILEAAYGKMDADEFKDLHRQHPVWINSE